MAAGSVRLPELRQDIKINTSDLTRARRLANGFKQAMEKDLDIDTSKVGAAFQTLKNRLEKFRETTSQLSDDMSSLRQDFERISKDLDTFGNKFDEAGKKVGGLQEKLAELKKTAKIDVKIDVDDDSLEQARAKLDTFKDETKTVKINVEVDRSQLDSLLSAIESLRSSMGSSFNVDTSDWMSKMGEVNTTLQEIKGHTDRLYQSAIHLGAAMKLARTSTEELKKELIELQAVAEKGINVKVDIDDKSLAAARLRLREALQAETIKVKIDLDEDSLAAVKALIEAGLNDETVTIKVDVDTSALDGAAAKVRAMADNIQSSLNVDTSKWTEQTQEVLDRLDELKTTSHDLMKNQHELATAFQLARVKANTLKNEVIELQAIAAKGVDINVTLNSAAVARAKAALLKAFKDLTVKVNVELDTDSLEVAKALIDVTLNDQTVKVKVDVDTSSLDGAAAKIKKMSSQLSSAFVINTKKWTTDVDGVIAKLDGLATATKNLNTSQHDLGTKMKDIRNDITLMGAAAEIASLKMDALQNRIHDVNNQDMSKIISSMDTLRKHADANMRLGDSVALANRRAAAAYEEMSKRGKTAVDELQGSMGGLQNIASSIQQAFNIDTSKWSEQVQEATRILQELRDVTNGLSGDADDLGGSMRDQRDDIATSDAQWEDLLETLHRIEGRFGKLGEQINATSAITNTYAVSTRDSMSEAERAFTGVERAHGRVAKAARDLAEAKRLIEEKTLAEEIAVRKLLDANEKYASIEDEIAQKDRDAAELRERLTETTELLERAEDRLATIRASRAKPSAALVLDADRDIKLLRKELEEQTKALGVAEDERSKLLGKLTTVQREALTVSQQVITANNDVAKGNDAAAEAEERHSRAQIELGNTSKYTSNEMNKASQAFDRASSSGTNLNGTLRRLKLAFIGLSVIGLIVPGIGTLVGAVIGLGAAISSLLPAALLLPGILTSIGASAAAMFVIFKDNKYLEAPVKRLGESFKEVKTILQRDTAPAITRFLDQVGKLAPIVEKWAHAFTKAFTEISDSFTKYVGSQGFMNDLSIILASSIVQFKNLGMAASAAFQGFIGLASAAQPMLDRMSATIRETAEEFRDWVNQARGTGELTRMFERMAEVFDSLLSSVKNLVIGFKQLFDISNMSGFTDRVLATLNGITQDFRKFTATNQGLLAQMFDNLGKQVALLRPLFASVADGIRIILTNVDLTPLVDAIRQVMTNFAEGAAEAANAIGRLVREAAPAINQLITLIRNLIPDVERIGTAFLREVTPAIEAARPGVERLGEMLARIAEDVLPVLGAAATNLGHIFSGIVGILAPIGEVIGNIVGFVGGLTSGLGMLLTAVVALKIGSVIFGGMGRAISGAAQPTTRLQAAMAGLTAPIRSARTSFSELNTQMADNRARSVQAGESLGKFANFADAAQGSSGRLMGTLGTMSNTLLTNAQRGREAAASLLTISGEAGRTTNALGNVVGGAKGATIALGQGLKGAVSGLVSAMGGMSGLILTGIVAALGAWAQRSAEVKGETDKLRGALEQSNGAIDESTRRTIQATLETHNLAAGSDALGISQTEVANAVSGTEEQFQSMIARLQEHAGAAYEDTDALGTLGEASNELDANFGLTDAAIGELIDSMKRQRAEMLIQQRLVREAKEDETRRQNSMTQSQRATENFTKALEDLNQTQGDVSKTADALGRALDGMNGSLKPLREAQSDLNEQIRDGGQSMEEYRGQVQNLDQVFQGTTEAGSALQDSTTGISDAARDAAASAFQAAGGVGNLGAANAAARGEVDKARAAIVQMAKDAGLGDQAAQDLANSLLGIPGDIEILLNTNLNQVQKEAELAKNHIIHMRDSLNNLPPNTPVKVTALTEDAIRNLEQTRGLVVERIPGTKDVIVRAPNGEFIQDVNGMLAHVENPPGGPPEITPQLQPGPAQAEAQRLHEFIPAPNGGPPIIIPGLQTQPAEQQAGVLVQGIEDQRPIMPVDINDTRAQIGIETLVGNVELPPAGSPLMPVGTDITVGERNLLAFVNRIRGYQEAIIPVHANVTFAENEIGQFVNRIRGYREAILPIYANLRDFGEREVLAWVDRIKGFREAKLPIYANVQPGEQEALAWVARINGFRDAKLPIYMNDQQFRQDLANLVGFVNGYNPIPRMPIGANFDELTRLIGERKTLIETGAPIRVPMSAAFEGGTATFTTDYVNKRTSIEQGAPWLVPMTTEWERYFTPAYVAKRDSIWNGAPWLVPMAPEWDRYFTPQYEAKRDSIQNGAPWMIPMSLDLREVDRQYRELVQILTQPIMIPVGLQFSFGGFGGGGGVAAAAGAIIANETGNILSQHEKVVKKFAKGGFGSQPTKRDILGLGDAYKAYAPGGVEDRVAQKLAQNGVTPMAANRASIVPPNSFRIIGDRAQDDEAYIPINQDSRSLAIFEETARRMGYYVEKMAVGGFSSTSNATNSSNPSTASEASRNVTNNTTEAPMVGGDLIITVPSETPVQDSMDEVLFQLRRMKRGGVYVRSAMRGA